MRARPRVTATTVSAARSRTCTPHGAFMCIDRANAPTARGPSRKWVSGSMLVTLDADKGIVGSSSFRVWHRADVLAT